MIGSESRKNVFQILPRLNRIFFFFPGEDERPAGIEDTFLLCPAPVIEEVGR